MGMFFTFEKKTVSGIILASSLITRFSEAQINPFNFFGNKLVDDISGYQSCFTDEDCVYANHGVCDCANGGKEVAVNEDMLDDFKQLFDSRRSKCTKMTRPVPCGIGGGITCQNQKCVFETCKDISKAVLCRKNTDEGQSIEECMRNACEDKEEILDNILPDESSISNSSTFVQEEKIESFSNSSTFVQDEKIQIQYQLERGKLPQIFLNNFQECAKDDDCVYANNGFCDCANGGEQVAVNKDNLEDFENLFKPKTVPCTKKGSPIPCDIGGGIKCESGQCVFRQCGNMAKAMECPYGEGSKECLVEACESENENKFLRPVKSNKTYPTKTP